MKSRNRELMIPPAVELYPQAFEVLRVWVSPQGPVVSLLPDTWSDPAAWGVFLVDLAKHVANGQGHENAAARTRALNRIKEGFDAEWTKATSEPKGGFLLE